uniref:Tetraspanin n=1 Tax=Cacopsylla melanoneura TaxID=428564 RepID=A0A8D8VXT7_9HEMI
MGTMMEPCSCLSKYLICIFNFLLFVMGSISVAVGLWVHLDKQSFSKFLSMVDHSLRFPGLSGFTHPDALTDASILLIVAGGLICIVSFLGYCGACCNSSCMMTLYGCFILIFLIMQIAAGCLAFFYKQRVGDEIRLFLKDSIRDYYNVSPVNQSNSATLMWNYLMAQLSCCGVDDFTDFNLSRQWNTSGLQVPPACCNLVGNKFDFQPLDPDCVYHPSDVNSYYRIVRTYLFYLPYSNNQIYQINLTSLGRPVFNTINIPRLNSVPKDVIRQ